MFNNNKIIINKEKVECEVENNKIKYNEEDNTINIVDLINNIYIRESNNFLFKIDFNKEIFSYTLKEKNVTFSNQLLSCSILKEEKIILKYKLDEEEKMIIIQML